MRGNRRSASSLDSGSWAAVPPHLTFAQDTAMHALILRTFLALLCVVTCSFSQEAKLSSDAVTRLNARAKALEIKSIHMLSKRDTHMNYPGDLLKLGGKYITYVEGKALEAIGMDVAGRKTGEMSKPELEYVDKMEKKIRTFLDADSRLMLDQLRKHLDYLDGNSEQDTEWRPPGGLREHPTQDTP